MDILVGLLNATHTVPDNPSVVFQLVKRVAGVDVEIFEGCGQEEAVGVQVHSWGQQVALATIGEVANDGVAETVAVQAQLVSPSSHWGQKNLCGWRGQHMRCSEDLSFPVSIDMNIEYCNPIEIVHLQKKKRPFEG